jgi:hypothetical protein
MYEFEKPSYIFMAIEDTDIESIKNSLTTLESLPENQIDIVSGNSNDRKFNKFNMIADLYIWTSKYWYGTYYEKLTYVRLKNVNCIPLNFTIKYHNDIRLLLKSRFSYIVNESDSNLLKEVWVKSLRDFDKRRIQAITPGMKKLKNKWDVLISNRNYF